MALIQGTNAGEIYTTKTFESSGSFFKDGVQTQIISAPKAGHSLDVIILPSFDPTKGASEYKKSYIPYRELNSDLMDPITKSPAYTGWAKACKAYTFFGNNKKNFVSPLTGKAYRAVTSKKDNKVRYYPPANIDPIVDIGNYIFFNQDKVDPATKRLLEKNAKGQQPLPRAPKSYILSNALVSVDKGEWKFKVIAYTESAYVDLVKLLAWRTSKSQTGLTPAFDDFLFGDITDPLTGSILSVSLKETGANGPNFAGFNISDDNINLQGRRPIPQGLITPEILEKRVVLNDTDYLDIWSYQQIVDFLVQDGQIPINIIKAAVKPGTNIEVSSSNPSSPVLEQSEPEDDLEYNIPFMNAPQHAVQQPAAPQTVSKPEEVVVTETATQPKISTDDPKFKEYVEISKKVIEGTADGDMVYKFLDLQAQFGPISNYNL